jgi:hypothetical protein
MIDKAIGLGYPIFDVLNVHLANNDQDKIKEQIKKTQKRGQQKQGLIELFYSIQKDWLGSLKTKLELSPSYYVSLQQILNPRKLLGVQGHNNHNQEHPTSLPQHHTLQ